MSIELTKNNFTALNDTNYAEWATRMEADLIRKKLWTGVVVIDAEPPTALPMGETEAWWKKLVDARSKAKMAEARAEMIARVEDGQLSHMQSRDPMEIWNHLAQIHVARGFATRLALRRQFMRFRKEDEVMAAWIGRVKAFAFRMEKAGIQVTDEDRILTLTNGLDESYEPFVISLDATPSDQLTLSHVIDRLISEEMRRGGHKPDTKRTDGAYIAQSKNGSGRGRGSGGGDSGNGAEGYGSGGSSGGMPTCWRCGKQGHIRAFCREEPVRGSSPNPSKNEAAMTAVHDISQLQVPPRDYGTIEIGSLRLPGHVL